MQFLLVLSALVASAFAIACPPDACANVEKPLLNCLGTTLKGSGWCGCTDSCALQKGEVCSLPSPFLLGVPAPTKCEDGLVCQASNLEGHFNTLCVDPKEDSENFMSKRQGLIVCPENACANVVDNTVCKGGRMEGAGWCGCTDVCKKVRGERCVPQEDFLLMDAANHNVCDDGLVCHKVFEGHPLCLMANETAGFVSKRSNHCNTPCQKKSQMCTFSFVIYEGQWFASCDVEGNYLPQQCNNKGECFCVDDNGTIDESTRVLGSAKC